MTDWLKSERWKHDPAPRYMPEPTPGALNELAEIAAVAKLMQWDLQPWQRRVLQVATEYVPAPNGERSYRYREVLITVPRQSGKTTLISPLGIFRALLRPRSEIYFSAQTGQYAGDYMKKLGQAFNKSWHPALRVAFEFMRSNGSEGFRCSNGSIFQRFTRGAEAMHSKTPQLVINDEIWSLSRDEGADLVGAVRPAQSTLGRAAQMWNLSTMGTIQSEYMNDLVEIGRSGQRADLCYVEYALPPDADPTDKALWPTFHPALGNTQTIETLTTDFEALWPKVPNEWIRGYCNRLTVAKEAELIPEWQDLDEAGEIARPAFGVELSARSYGACIVAAWLEDERPCIALVKQSAGLNWVIPALVQLKQAYPDAAIWLDKAGANMRIIDLIERTEAVDINTAGLNERQIGDAALLEAAKDIKTLRHDHSQAFTDAVAGLHLKTVNGRSRIDRDKSETDPMPFIAASVALYGATHVAERHAPMIFA